LELDAIQVPPAILFVMFFTPIRLASCLLLAASINASPQDDLLQHYKIAETFSEKGDQALAVAEYRLFLSQALRRLGNAQGQLRDFKAAHESFEEAASFAPDDPAFALDRALASLQAGDLSAAKVLAEKSLAADPNNARAQWVLGRVLFQQGVYAEAKLRLEATVVAAPGLDVGYTLGVTYLRLKDEQHARMLFADMLKGLGDTPEMHILISRAYEEVGAWREAIQQLTTGIARHPKAPQLHYFLGLAYATRDEVVDSPRAIQQFRAELEINSRDARSHYMLGYELLKQHELAGSESELRRATSLEPDSPDAFIDLAQLYLENQRLSEAEAAARKAIALTEDESRNDFQIHRAYYLLGRILKQTGHNEEAQEQMEISQRLRTKRLERQRARQDGTLAANDFESPSAPVKMEGRAKLARLIDQLKPALANAYNNLGVAAAAQQDFLEASKYFQKAAAWNPSLETVDRNWGMAEFYGKRYSAAIIALERHLAAHPDDTRARAALGLSYFTVENYAKTLSTLQPMEDTAQSDPGLASAYGTSLMKAGQFDRGMSLLKRVAEENPNSAEIHGLLGGAYADQGIYAPALEEYHKSLALDPAQAHVHFLLGLALIRQGKPADAIPELQTALQSSPSDTPAKYHLAFALLQIQKKSEARGLLEEVIKQDPKYFDAYYQLGKLQLEQGETKAAIGNLEAGSQLSPNSDYIHYQLAMAYRRDAQSGAAAREMQTYQELKGHRQGGPSPEK